MNKKLKIAIVGAGSSYTPELIEGLSEHRETLPVKEIVLLDIINSILPGLLPLILVLIFHQILVKQKKGMYICILACFVIGILGAVVHVF